MNCNMSKGTAEQIATTQGFAGLDCLKVLSPDDLEDKIGRHNKAMTGGNEQHKIFCTIVIRRLEALVHSVRVYSLTGKEFPLTDFSYDWQITRAVQELTQFRLAEQKYTEPESLKDIIL